MHPEGLPSSRVLTLTSRTFEPRKLDFSLDVTDDSVRFQHQIISAPVNLALEHLDITAAVSPHERKQLAEKNMTQCLLPQARIKGVHRSLNVGICRL